jgi:HlyD family secretion protein
MAMTEQQRKWIVRSAALVVVGMVAVLGWRHFTAPDGQQGLASGNGRIEAVEIDVASKSSGRIEDVRVHEGEYVTAGQVLAVMDTDVLDAQLRQAQAQFHQARSAVATATSQLAERESGKAAAQAVLVQRETEAKAARTALERARALAAKGFVAQQAVDDAQARLDGAEAAVGAARAQVAAAQAAIVSARSQIVGAQSTEAAARANVERIQADIDDATLKAPRDGRVQFVVARPGEVVGAGGRVVNLVDLTDVYMTFFLPTSAAGRLAIGSEARIVLDAAPGFVIPAHISFVADVAQFTPKTVETASEREKLMFRVRAQIAPELLKQYLPRVKTGLPGVAYVRLDDATPWPAHLAPNLPP